MNILKPQKILFKNLKNIENLINEFENTGELTNIITENYKKENIEFTDIKIEKSILNNIRLSNKGIDLANLVWEEFV